MALGIVQKVVVAGGVSDASCGEHIVEALWILMESGVEELRVLQTVTLLVTTNNAIAGENLAKVVCNYLTPYLLSFFLSLDFSSQL